MPSYCSVKDCSNKSSSNPDIIFHSFPSRTKHKSTFLAWKQLCKVKGEDFNWEGAYLCSEHFTADDYHRDLRNELLGIPVRKVLKRDAVPSIFPGRKGQSLEDVEARKERAERRKWVIERKQIVNDLLAKAAEEEAREQIKVEEIVPDVEQMTTDEVMIKIDPEKEAYLGLSKEHLRRKIDSLWQVISWKNKRITSLTSDVLKLKNVNEKQLKKIKTLERKASRKKATEEDLPVPEEESEIKEEPLPQEEILEEETITFMENDLTEFCNYNRRQLQALNYTRCADDDPLSDPLEIFQMEKVAKSKPRRVPRGKDKQKRPYPKRPKILKPVKPKKTWNCEKCPEIFSTLKLKMIHKREKHPWQIVEKTCPFCLKIFRGRAARHYNDHVNGHREDKSFLCSVCGKAFKKKSLLSGHLKNVHPKEASYICMFCGKSFKAVEYLRNHEKLHQGENLARFSCHLCELKFRDKRTLLKHIGRVHKKDGSETDLSSSSQNEKTPEILNEDALMSGSAAVKVTTDRVVGGASSRKDGSELTQESWAKTEKK